MLDWRPNGDVQYNSGEDKTMTMKLKQPKRQPPSVRHQVPWWTDVKAAREAALCAAMPCVIILNAESSAL